MPYVGAIADIPKNWTLCDGNNGTPNLTGRFLEGVTSNPKEFKIAGLPNITGFIYYVLGTPYGISSSPSLGNLKSSGIFSSTFSGGLNTSNQALYFGAYTLKIDASISSPVYRNDITTVQPNSYTVFYIMKIKK